MTTHMPITAENVSTIQAICLRASAESALADRPVPAMELYRHGEVETLVVGSKAGQAFVGSPSAEWGTWHAGARTVQLDGGRVVGLDGQPRTPLADGLHAFRFTAGPLTGDEFAIPGRTLEESEAGAAAWVASEPALAGSEWEQLELPAAAVEQPAENPRWTRCREALGREPSNTDFICWTFSRWEDFAKERGCKDSSEVRNKLGTNAHPAFDVWLAEGVAAGKWKEPRS